MRAAKAGRWGGVGVVVLVTACAQGGGTAADTGPEGLLAFNSERDGNYEVYVMSIGGPARNISADSGVDWAFAARDGMLYAVSTREHRWPRPAYDLYTLDPADGTLRRITDTLPVYDSFLGVDPAGERLVVCSRADGDGEIYLIDLFGVVLAKLTDNDAGDCDPDWSPDGRWIAFRSDRAGAWDIWRMAADGSDPVRLTNYPANDSLAHGYGEGPPRWSPDGRWIAWLSRRDGTDPEIMVMRADGTDLRQLTRNDGEDAYPSWSPDGQWIAFHSDRSGDYEIWVMRVDGSDARQLTDSPGSDIGPVWIR